MLCGRDGCQAIALALVPLCGAAMIAPTQIDLLELDIDLRLQVLWEALWQSELDPSELLVIATHMRAAYGHGYCDALREEQRGQLCIDNGFRIPLEGE